MQNYVVATWKGGSESARHYVLDIRSAPEIKVIAEAGTEGLARLLVAVLIKNDQR